MHPMTVFAAGALTTLLVGLVVQIGLESYLVHSDKTAGHWAMNATACATTGRTCQTGLAFMVDGQATGCNVLNEPVGAACASECYVEGTRSLTCNARQECVSTNASACLGFCSIDAAADPPVVYESAHPACEGKLTFRNFTKWNTPESARELGTWLYYTDYPAECNPFLGCLWYGFRFMLGYSPGAPLDVTTVSTTGIECLDFLDMGTTAADCIATKAIPIESEIATPVWEPILQEVDDVIDFPDGYVLQAEMCLFHYRCFVANETVFTDPAFLYGGGGKRALGGSTLRDRALEVFRERSRQPHPQLGAYLEGVLAKRR